MEEIRRFYIGFLHRSLEEYQKFTASTSPGVGVEVAFFVSVFRSHKVVRRWATGYLASYSGY